MAISKKIIYVANTRIPTEMAHGLQIMKMCEAFVNNGIEIELIVPLRFAISELGKKDPFDYYKVDKIFKIKKIFCFDLTPLNRFLGPISSLIQALSFSFFAFIYLLFKSVRRRGGKADIIYGRDRFDLFLISFFRPIVFEIHKIHRALDIRIAKRAKKIVTITDGLKNELARREIEKEKILIAPDGVDIKMFDVECSMLEARKRLNLPLNKKLVLYTGHLYKWKGVETLALASKYLNPKSYTLNPIIVFVGGIKWYLNNFRKFVKKENLKNISILGYRDYFKIPFYLKSADCLVLTGTRKSETSEKHTSPMKMFEYMASKRPIVASNLPSFREVLNETNSILVESDNPGAMAEGIKKVLSNPDLARQISEQAYKDAQNYTWENRARKILQFINF